MTAVRESLRAACHILEEARSLESEREANLLMSTSLLKHDVLNRGSADDKKMAAASKNNNSSASSNNNATVDVSALPGGIQDAWIVFSEASHMLGGGGGSSGDAAFTITNHLPKINYETRDALPIGQGQVGKATATATLSGCLDRASRLQNTLVGEKRPRDGAVLKAALDASKKVVPGQADLSQRATLWLQCLDERLREIKSYNARNSVTAQAATTLPKVSDTVLGSSSVDNIHNKRRRIGNPAADGYDLASSLVETLQRLSGDDGDIEMASDSVKLAAVASVDGTPSSTSTATCSFAITFSAEEVMGKYLDLQPIYEQYVVPMRSSIFATKDGAGFRFADFLNLLSKGDAGLTEGIDEVRKLQRDRKKYVRLLVALESYVEGFLRRTQPLLDLEKEVIAPAVQEFYKEWKEKGGYPPAWEGKPSESILAETENRGENAAVATKKGPDEDKKGINLSPFATADDLEKAVDGDALKAELSRLGLKCGGTVADRAKRLFMTKNTPLDKLPAKVFAKKDKGSTTSGDKGPAATSTAVIATTNIKSERRIDIARREVSIMALLNQIKPTLEATIRRTERRETQTPREREKELEEDLHGSTIEGPRNADGETDDSDDEDEVIYNPKGVPLDWDGKPMPYWLFKLHGLNHFYPCEICGGETYRGRRNFELHFAESRHGMGMKMLGIPNTKHFHGVTKIEDAQNLWTNLQGQLQEASFDGAKDEEYEDSHGRVLTRQAYEDLARQGLL